MSIRHDYMHNGFAEKFNFLDIVRGNVRHHAILLPDVYAMFDYRLFFEYLSFKNGESRDKIIASPDYLFCTAFAGCDMPIKIETVKQITSFAQGTAFGERKTIIVEDLDNATANALNALLKTLEEPSCNTTFYLMYSNIRNLPSTVVSRCYVVRENVNDAEHFRIITDFFGIEYDFELFARCGYDFGIYKRSLDCKDLGITEMLSRVSGNGIDGAFGDNAMLQLEKMLCDVLSRTTNFADMVKVESVIKKLFTLKNACEVFNTNKHASIIELTEKVHELVS